MSEIVIAGRPIPALWIGAALPVLALLYVGYVGFMAEENINAKIEAANAQETSVAEKQDQAQQLATRTKEIDKVKREIQDLERAVTLLKNKIPSEAQVPVLLYDIERMARASQGEMNSFQPGQLRGFGQGDQPAGQPADTKNAPAGTQDIMELPVTIQCTATYPEVIKFLSQVSNYERKLNVSNIKVAPGKSQSGAGQPGSGKEAIGFKNTLSVEFTVSAYILKAGGAQP
jgi:Tfp pilus assembly protein PilO